MARAGVIDEQRAYTTAQDFRRLPGNPLLKVSISRSSTSSGGNQQKVVLSKKWLFVEPRVRILDEPTRGIDIGAKFEIYTIMAELAAQGKSIVMISSEMPELLGMCDRIYVMNEGRFVAEFDGADATAGKDHARDRCRGKQLMETKATYRSAGRGQGRRGDGVPEEQPESEYGMLLSLIAIMCFFQYMTEGTLLQPLNLTHLILQNSYIVIMALGMLLVIVAGQDIDLPRSARWSASSVLWRRS